MMEIVEEFYKENVNLEDVNVCLDSLVLIAQNKNLIVILMLSNVKMEELVTKIDANVKNLIMVNNVRKKI